MYISILTPCAYFLGCHLDRNQVRKPTPSRGKINVRSGNSLPITDDRINAGHVMSLTIDDNFWSNRSPMQPSLHNAQPSTTMMNRITITSMFSIQLLFYCRLIFGDIHIYCTKLVKVFQKKPVFIMNSHFFCTFATSLYIQQTKPVIT